MIVLSKIFLSSFQMKIQKSNSDIRFYYFPQLSNMAGLSPKLLLLLLLSYSLVTMTIAQSNEGQFDNSISYPNPSDGLPKTTVLAGKVTSLDELSTTIVLNRTRASLNCAAGFMQVCVKDFNLFLKHHPSYPVHYVIIFLTSSLPHSEMLKFTAQ